MTADIKNLVFFFAVLPSRVAVGFSPPFIQSLVLKCIYQHFHCFI